MSYQLTDQERQATLRLSAEKRYDHFINKVVETGQIWILSDDQGCVIVHSDGEQCVPVWPHADYATAWATEEWADCRPTAIDLETWMARWTPGLQEDELMLAVFPHADEQGVVATPLDLEDSLLYLLDRH